MLATGLVATAVPAHADTYTVIGQRACPSTQNVNVSVTLNRSANAVFYRGNSNVYTSRGGTIHTYNYGRSSAQWKVTSLGDIRTVSDTCVRRSATREPAE